MLGLHDSAERETLAQDLARVGVTLQSWSFIPDSLWERHSIFCDINVTLYDESATQPEVSQSRAYHLLISVGAKQVIKIYKGIKRWYAYCPKCKRDGKNFNRMIGTQGLVNFEQATVRQKEAESEYETTHPDHQSKWEANMETVKEHNRNEEVEDE